MVSIASASWPERLWRTPCLNGDVQFMSHAHGLWPFLASSVFVSFLFFLNVRCENGCLLVTISFPPQPLVHAKSLFFYCTMFAILALHLLTLVQTIHRCDKLILPRLFIVLCNQWYCVETLVECRERVCWVVGDEVMDGIGAVNANTVSCCLTLWSRPRFELEKNSVGVNHSCLLMYAGTVPKLFVYEVIRLCHICTKTVCKCRMCVCVCLCDTNTYVSADV